LQNALSELDQRGVVSGPKVIDFVFWPPVQSKKAIWKYPSPIRCAFESAKNVLIENFTLEKARGDAIVARDSENIVIQNCTIQNVGNRAQ